MGFDLGQRDRRFHRHQRLHIDHAEHAFGIGVIGIMLLDDLDHADDLLFIDRMIEEPPVADLHRLHIVVGLMIAHTIPLGRSFLHLIVP